MGGEFKIMYFTPSNLLYGLPSGKYMFFLFKKIMWKIRINPIHNLIDPTCFLTRLKLPVFLPEHVFNPNPIDPT